MQQLFATHKGTNVLSLTMNKKPVTGAEGQNGLFASAVCDKNKNEIIVKVVNTSGKKQSLSLIFNGLKRKKFCREHVVSNSLPLAWIRIILLKIHWQLFRKKHLWM